MKKRVAPLFSNLNLYVGDEYTRHFEELFEREIEEAKVESIISKFLPCRLNLQAFVATCRMC